MTLSLNFSDLTIFPFSHSYSHSRLFNLEACWLVFQPVTWAKGDLTTHLNSIPVNRPQGLVHLIHHPAQHHPSLYTRGVLLSSACLPRIVGPAKR
jgi:hypothetical protein